jgi:hypothetical protein
MQPLRRWVSAIVPILLGSLRLFRSKSLAACGLHSVRVLQHLQRALKVLTRSFQVESSSAHCFNRLQHELPIKSPAARLHRRAKRKRASAAPPCCEETWLHSDSARRHLMSGAVCSVAMRPVVGERPLPVGTRLPGRGSDAVEWQPIARAAPAIPARPPSGARIDVRSRLALPRLRLPVAAPFVWAGLATDAVGQAPNA